MINVGYFGAEDRVKTALLYWEELRDLGFHGSLYRLWYELRNRSGLTQVLAPGTTTSETDKMEIWGDQKVTLDFFSRNRKPFFLSSIKELQSGLSDLLSEEQKLSVVRRANLAIEGTIRCYSKWEGAYGNPVEWHLNPVSRVVWPKDVHYSKALHLKQECGEVKHVWEINRLPHFFDFLRAYAITSEVKYLDAIVVQTSHWYRANPFRRGVNWSSGQELAIRVFIWLLCLYTLIDSGRCSEETLQLFCKVIYLHALHINKNIGFSRVSVHNNHLIAEASALYLVGCYMPWMKEADEWKKTGREILTTECPNQFYVDGGYCQNSHNYHRLALSYYLWVLRAAEILNEPFSYHLYDMMNSSAKYLYSSMNLEDGRLPNWGANDGALLAPWTGCDFSDFRPIVASMFLLTQGRKIFESGPWDEELLWLWGSSAMMVSKTPESRRSVSFLDAGIHILRVDAQNFVSFRCGSFKDRFGQADQLHTDIWMDGVNLACDGGSYLYNEERERYRYFAGTRSHNTMTIDGQDQMLLWRQFKWLRMTKAKLIEFDAPSLCCFGEHYGYQRLGVLHRRKIMALTGNCWVVADILEADDRQHDFALHWLISTPDTRYFHDDRSIEIGAADNPIHLSFGFSSGENVAVELINKGTAQEPYGLVSRYFGCLAECSSVRLRGSLYKDTAIISMFQPANRYTFSAVSNTKIKLIEESTGKTIELKI
ncbi:hypothetical protein D4R75_16125 [bacterium]|nr:MAG: hypothetical protein D4R75_16125 [bacterium]